MGPQEPTQRRLSIMRRVEVLLRLTVPVVMPVHTSPPYRPALAGEAPHQSEQETHLHARYGGSLRLLRAVRRGARTHGEQLPESGF